MDTQDAQIWHSAFHPDANADSLSALRNAYFASRREHGGRVLAVCAEIDSDATEEAFGNGVMEVLEAASEGTDALFVDPVFSTWVHFLNRAVTRRDKSEIEFHCGKLSEVVERVKSRLAGKEPHYIAGTHIAVQQDDIASYVMAATPPSYDFSKVLASKEGRNGHGHPLSLQQELLGFALENIRKVWPELRAQIEDVVKIVGYLPDASFRSCSAARYAGVVYLGNMDERILDIEESIVHEAGHQVLYRLGELAPLVVEGTPQTPDYTLPWSGSKRDLFGFLHAFYIYTLLTKYFWRRSRLNEQERKDCVQRAVLIQFGSRQAIEMLLPDQNLSPRGRSLVEVLAKDMAALEAEIDATYGNVFGRHD